MRIEIGALDAGSSKKMSSPSVQSACAPGPEGSDRRASTGKSVSVLVRDAAGFPGLRIRDLRHSFMTKERAKRKAMPGDGFLGWPERTMRRKGTTAVCRVAPTTTQSSLRVGLA